MSPSRRMARGGPGDARNRRMIAAKYLEAAELVATEEGAAANNVIVGIAALAGIAAGDAICLSATGSRYAGDNPGEAAKVLAGVDRQRGAGAPRAAPAKLVRLKPGAHYGAKFMGDADRTRALRAASTLVGAATERTLGA